MPLIRIKNCLNCDGKSHEWEFTAPRLKEMRVLQAKTGLTMQDWQDRLNDMDAEALTGLIDILHRREGVNLRWDDIDLDFEDMDMLPTDEEAALAMADLNAEPGKGEAPPES